MTNIFKYVLKRTETQIITIPLGAKPLSVQLQNNEICLWAEVNELNIKCDRKVHIIGTGQGFHKGCKTSDIYIGTVQDVPFVWHIYTEQA